jgi:hyperosmotically inducible periplasmic protein
VIRASVLALLVLVATSGCGALTGRPLETWAQDRGLTARVKARLAASDAGTLTRVHVDTYESIVYLTGGVTSTEMKRHAEEIARGVTGVEQVVNNLHLAGANAFAAADSDVSASPPMVLPRRVAAPGGDSHPFLQRFRGLARVDVETGTPAWTRYAVYDSGGRRVATMYSMSAAELTRNGAAAGLDADDGIDHVAIYRDGAPGAVLYDLVLWHVTREDVARLAR